MTYELKENYGNWKRGERFVVDHPPGEWGIRVVKATTPTKIFGWIPPQYVMEIRSGEDV